METNDGGRIIVYNFQWKIDNVSHIWWFEKGEYLDSPNFFADEQEGTKWNLSFYPKGEKYEGVDGIFLYIKRVYNCKRLDMIQVKYRVAFLDNNGSFLNVHSGLDDFEGDLSSMFSVVKASERILVTQKEDYLSDDTFTVQCTLWKKEKLVPCRKENLVKSKYLYARTVLNTTRNSFAWKIDNFSTLQPGLRKKFKNDLIEFDFVLNEEFCKQLNMDLILFNDRLKYISCNTWIIASEGEKENCGFKKYFNIDLKKGEMSIMLIFPTKFYENKNHYFPNDVLSLEFETVISTVEHSDWRKNSANEDWQEKYEDQAVLINDLKSMYNDKILSDIELRTLTKTFPAHKNILSARSQVFKRMFSHDMKEKNSGQVDIIDLEDDTVQRMLLFMYTGFLDDLNFEKAFKLYAAADKYEISFIKNRCSSFLKGSLCPTTACDILSLSDRHHDLDLKNAVQAYILMHEEVFQSLEWKILMETNEKLAVDIISNKINNDI